MFLGTLLLATLITTGAVCLRLIVTTENQVQQQRDRFEMWEHRTLFLVSKAIYMIMFANVLILTYFSEIVLWETFVLLPILLVCVTTIQYCVLWDIPREMWYAHTVEMWLVTLLLISGIQRYPSSLIIHVLNVLSLLHIMVAERHLLRYMTIREEIQLVDIEKMLIPYDSPATPIMQEYPTPEDIPWHQSMIASS
jgi:hypothetical protein